MTIDEQIEQETQLINKLEATHPKMDPNVGFYHKNNTPWHIHHTELRDAYWRRRRFIAKKEGLEDPVDVY